MEALFLQDSSTRSYRTPEWTRLVQVRKELVTSRSVYKAVTFLIGQLRQLHKKKKDNPGKRKNQAGAAPAPLVLNQEFWRLLRLLLSWVPDHNYTITEGDTQQAHEILTSLLRSCPSEDAGEQERANKVLDAWVCQVRMQQLQQQWLYFHFMWTPCLDLVSECSTLLHGVQASTALTLDLKRVSVMDLMFSYNL